jgi:hypothetical protein
MSDDMLKPWFRRVPAVAAVWMVVAAFLASQLWPQLPRSWLQWFLLFAIGPPLYVLGEAFFVWLFSGSHGRAVSPRAFSFARVAMTVDVAIMLFVFSWWMSLWLTGT